LGRIPRLLGLPERTSSERLDFAPPDRWLAALAGHTGRPLPLLREATLGTASPLERRPAAFWRDAVAPGDWFLRDRAYRGKAHPRTIQFCPDCMNGGQPYLRRRWRLALYSACLRHRRILLNRCEKCGAAVKPLRLRGRRPDLRTCWSCGESLTSTRGPPASPFVIRLERALEGASENKIILDQWRSALGRSLARLITFRELEMGADMQVSVPPQYYGPKDRHDAVARDKPALERFCAFLEEL